LVFADDLMLVTLGPGSPNLPGRVEVALRTAGSHWPDIL
jgi:hypothetical protein